MGLFGNKKKGIEEEKGLSRKRTSAKTILMLFFFLVGILLGSTIEHYLIEPDLNNDLGGKLSECRGSLDLVNREVSNCYEELEALQAQTPTE
ncbi:hypothetical protein KKE06_05980 [Candidatus Micrarchaeota archaeon]|nr:hypothetical protein [Candidatus Micrarchaeota archaeon]MBU1930425.1 hypothetical protein [Candidatus Micrarchaeota archaeon]